MTLFSFVAVDNNGGTKNGTIERPSRSAAIEAIRAQNLKPISIREKSQKNNKIDLNNLFGGSKIKSSQLVMFTRQLSAMVSAGVPLPRALNALAGHAPDKSVLQKTLLSIVRDIESGISLSEAMSKYPTSFNSVYTNMVKAGESAGILDEILKRLAQEQEKNASIKKKIRSSMAYPVVLLVITVLAFFGLMLFVIPQIGGVLTDLGGSEAKLPGLTVFMLDVSKAMTTYWYIIIPSFLMSIMGFLFYIKTKTGRSQFDYVVLKIPIINTIVTKVAIAHFARTFSALIEAGVAVLEALTVTSHAIGNTVYEKAILAAEVEVKNGKNLSTIIGANPLFPPIVSQMLAVGEETGQTEMVLVKVAEFYEEEVDVAIDGLSSIIEPVMIVIMGGAVGLIAASVMLPIAGMAESIK